MESNWCTVSEITNRQIGCNPLFDKKFYGSLNTVIRLEPANKIPICLEDFFVCDLSFNRKGNLLACSTYNNVSIWDWARRKKHHSFRSHLSFGDVTKVRWLPDSEENDVVALCEHGNIYLLDLEHTNIRKLEVKFAEDLAVNPDLPNNIFTVGTDGRVILIDIRESKSHNVLTQRNGPYIMYLHCVDWNPLNSNEFCVAGQSPYVMVYDVRNLSEPLLKLCPRHMKFEKYACVIRTVYNYNGREILVPYAMDNVYLFDTLKARHGGLRKSYAHKYRIQSIVNEFERQGILNDLGGILSFDNNSLIIMSNDRKTCYARKSEQLQYIKVIDFFGPKSEYVISAYGYVIIWDKNTAYMVQKKEAKNIRCMAIHPRFPILVTNNADRTSGFDVWMLPEDIRQNV